MKTLLTFIFLTISLFGFGQIKYPIQTIYKGDSVVILSIKQSITINRAIETQKKIIREQNKKIVALNKTIDSLSRINNRVNTVIDSIQYIADTTYKWADEFNMVIRERAIGPCLLYTIPPYNSVFFLDLSRYRMYSTDYGEKIELELMSDKQYAEFKRLQDLYLDRYYPTLDYYKEIGFKDFNSEIELYEKAIWKNKNIMRLMIKQEEKKK
ncbi:hypothetical protein UFOVP117_177 [uncultured Caudovirales phage]|uniref:Uncharacterized protein n=1 Tax=uncultured Caudovirales phage TaxID=2100421 RepID=A0A6J5L6G2_9CAUD|nr:hypothetical protein UFOVP117_177 [uncultured Caudovirales phage]